VASPPAGQQTCKLIVACFSSQVVNSKLLEYLILQALFWMGGLSLYLLVVVSSASVSVSTNMEADTCSVVELYLMF